MIYTVPYDRSTTRIVPCKSNLQPVYDSRVRQKNFSKIIFGIVLFIVRSLPTFLEPDCIESQSETNDALFKTGVLYLE